MAKKPKKEKPAAPGHPALWINPRYSAPKEQFSDRSTTDEKPK